MDNEYTKQMVNIVQSIKKQRLNAKQNYDNECKYITSEVKSTTINISHSGALGKVADIYNKARKAADDYYSTVTALFLTLDNDCRTFLENGAEAYGIKQVIDEMKELIDSCDINVAFNGTFQGADLGDFHDIQYIAPIEAKTTYKLWEIKYNQLPATDRNEAEARIKKEEKERLKAIEDHNREIQNRIEQEKILAEKNEESELENYKKQFLDSIKKDLDKKVAEEANIKRIQEEYQKEFQLAIENAIATFKESTTKRKEELEKQKNEIVSCLNDKSNKKQFNELNEKLDSVDAELETLSDDSIKERISEINFLQKCCISSLNSKLNNYINNKYSKKIILDIDEKIKANKIKKQKPEEIIAQFIFENEPVTLPDIKDYLAKYGAVLTDSRIGVYLNRLYDDHIMDRTYNREEKRMYFSIHDKSMFSKEESQNEVYFIENPEYTNLSMPVPEPIADVISNNEREYQTKIEKKINNVKEELSKRHKKKFIFF